MSKLPHDNKNMESDNESARFEKLLRIGDELNNSYSPDAALDLYREELKSFDINEFAITGFPQIKMRLNSELIHNQWEPRWADVYLKKLYHQIDPVFIAAQTELKPFLWSEKRAFGNQLTKELEEFYADADSHGMTEGLCLPVRFETGNRYVTSCRLNQPLSDLDQKYLYILSTYLMHKIVIDFRSGYIFSALNAQITSREQECLQWVAEGKTSSEVGEILQLTKDTIDFHIKNACRKLAAVNRTQAIAKAFRIGVLK